MKIKKLENKPEFFIVDKEVKQIHAIELFNDPHLIMGEPDDKETEFWQDVMSAVMLACNETKEIDKNFDRNKFIVAFMAIQLNLFDKYWH